ncbi:acetyl-CoA hydrolase/transferase family protein [Chloroflexota bacterium]
MLNWKQDYEKKFISAEEAASMVKSGSRLAFTLGREAFAVGMAIAARKNELKDVRIHVPNPGHDFGWYDEGWQDSFEIVAGFLTDTCQEALHARRIDYLPGNLFPHQHIIEFDNSDILITEVSAPDELGFCSFGAAVWRKKQQIRAVREKGGIVIAEVNERLIRPCGDGYIHVSEIDYFVEHIHMSGVPGTGSLVGRAVKEPEPYLKNLVQNVAELIKDGDTIQIGVGRATEPLVRLGVLDGRRDLGVHSEATPPGIISLVQEGVINGSCKTLNKGKVVVTSIGGSSREEMQWVDRNPLFHLVDSDYLEDVSVIAANDNMVSINQAMIVDLEGQSGAESVGWRRRSMSGGQISFAIGALHARGGRSITVIPSTARTPDGTVVSRIVSIMPEGTRVTIPAMCMDCVVTEYGVANLRSKSARLRTQELINVAHPDFRDELRRSAQKMFYP